MKLSIACHICNTRFDIEITTDLYGVTSWTYQGCLEITTPYQKEFIEHMNNHRLDGSWLRKNVEISRFMQRNATAYEGIIAEHHSD